MASRFTRAAPASASAHNLGVTKIVRGTNRQNQVLEEAFEATLPFHQDTLEPFFAACGSEPKLYYERRARQYNNDPLIKKTHIVNLRILTQTFVGMFLDAPHEAHRHEAKLLEKYAGDSGSRKIFREGHSPAPYFVCGLTWYMFEKYFRDDVIDKRYRTYTAHLWLIFRYSVGLPLPKLIKSRAVDSYCEKLLAILQEPQFKEQVRTVLDVFDRTERHWTQQGGSRFGIKDNKEFTELLVKQSQTPFPNMNTRPTIPEEEREIIEGVILRLVWRDGLWFGFIKRGVEYENVYFDSRGYRGEPRELIPDRRVRFEIGRKDRGLFARNVEIYDV